MPSKKTRSATQKAKPSAGTKKIVRLALPAMLDMRGARNFKLSLSDIFEQRKDCTIDASAVTRISVGCLQILLAFTKSMTACGRRVALTNPSSELGVSIELLGLGSAFKLYYVER